MADTPEKSLGPNDWDLLAQWARDELARRKTKRHAREQDCKEVDRQIEMRPKVRQTRDGSSNPAHPAWYPTIEMPLQFNALEVISADVRRLTFPRAGSWYRTSAAITDEYRERWDANRLKSAMVGNMAFPMDLDQETADVLAKQTIEHFHAIYDFKASVGLFNSEQIKYGTGIVRVRPVRAGRSANEYRGEWSEETIGPKVIPCTFWHTYLDDRWSALLHEGEMIGPTIIRWIGSQPLDDLKLAAEMGGADEGWLPNEVNRLVGRIGPDGAKETVELIEVEGDLLVPQIGSRAIHLPNSIIRVACGAGANSGVVRFKRNPMPFRSYVVGHYFKHDSRHAYGDSPLMKGVPLQDIATEAGNDFTATSRLNALPPVVWDRADPVLAANGGPQVYPGAMWQSSSPQSIVVTKIGDPNAALNATLAMIKQHEDTTGVNDARRGQRLKSHTTAEAANIEASQGISRTDDFVTDNLAGPLTTILHMEYEIAKASMKEPQYVRIDAEGIEGWVKLKGTDLADMVEFTPLGAEGLEDERQRARNFMEASAFVIGTVMPASAQAAALTGAAPVALDFTNIAREAYDRAGVIPTKFIGAIPALTSGVAEQSLLPADALGNPEGAVGPEGEAVPPEQPAAPSPAIG